MSLPAQAQACPAPDLAGRQQIWTGTVTVGTQMFGPLTVLHGFDADVSVGSRSDTMFDVGSNSHTIERIAVFVIGSPRALRFSLSSSLTTNEVASLTLHLCGDDYAFADATYRASSHSYTWESADLDWSMESSRTLFLSVPAAGTSTPATGAPAITGTAQVGETLTAVTTGIFDADGLTLTGNRRLRQDIRQDMARLESRLNGSIKALESRFDAMEHQFGESLDRLLRTSEDPRPAKGRERPEACVRSSCFPNGPLVTGMEKWGMILHPGTP